MGMGWDTSGLTNDPVNYAMDLGQDWQEQLQSVGVQINPSCANFVCHSDGGTRPGSCSAAAWILEATVLENGLPTNHPIAPGGKYIGSPISPFLAEAIALDEATSYMSRFISTSPENQVRRARVR